MRGLLFWGVLLWFGAAAGGAFATVIDLSTLTHTATIQATGLYDDAQLQTWNGQPLSPTNHPTPFEDALTSTWDFYVDPNALNVMYVVASDVHDTNYFFINGAPFDLVALTGFSFQLDVTGQPVDPAFSNQFALPGEVLLGPSASSSEALLTTPGWDLVGATGPSHHRLYSIAAESTNDGLTHFSTITNANRIGGGAAFQFVYSPQTDLLKSADFTSLEASAINGNGAYVETGALTFAYSKHGDIGVPEPSTWGLLAVGIGLLGIALRRAGGRRAPAGAAGAG